MQNRNSIDRLGTAFAAGLLGVAVFSSAGLSSTVAQAAVWRTDFSEAWQEAQQTGRPLLVHFYADWCGPCRQMERSVLNTSEVLAQLRDGFIAVKVDADEHPELIRRFGVQALPTDLLIGPNGRILSRTTGFQEKSAYLTRLSRVESLVAQGRRLRMANQPKAPRSLASGQNAETRPESPNRRVPDPRPAALPERPIASASPRHPTQPAPIAKAEPEAEPAPKKSSTPEVRSDAGSPRTAFVGLDGYSPVALKKWRKWIRGRPEFAADYQGVTFYMATREEWEAFRENPSVYAPRMLGCD
ncbi:MAG: thioredoxin fold domain-containing protein, partial [Planctomycetes bacterium]|nr:thioredoxin fold domain-containing protein [Planctomycetota bacterium]